MNRFDLTPAKNLSVHCARFDAPEQFAAFLAGPVSACQTRHWGDDNNSFHGAGAADTLARAQTGDLKRVALSDAMLDRMESAVGFEARRWRTLNAVAGGSPNVAAYLAGSPVAMRRRVRAMDAAAPLTIAIEMTVSAAVTPENIARRGAAALALARIAAASRPVTLWAVYGCQSDKRHAAFAVRIETAPLDLARAAWMLCAPEACRRAAFSVCHVLADWDMDGESVQWMRDHNDTMAAILPALTGASDLVTVAGLNSEDGKAAFANDTAAAAWVKSMLATHGMIERAA
jgi:hypothetical protein